MALLAKLLETLAVAEVQRCRDGTEALAAFTAAPDQFQVVITDLDMPGMSGIELCRRLHAVAPHLRIVLVTGSSVASEADARQSGFCGLLAKPFPAATLRRVLESVGLLNPAKPCLNN